MNKKMKTATLAIALIGILGIGSSAAWGSVSKNSEVDLNDIIRFTTGNNSELNLFEKKIKVKDRWYHEALDEDNDKNDYDKEMRLYVYPFKRDWEINELEWQRAEKQDQVVLKATEAYYNIMLQNEMIEIQEKKIERLTQVLENKKQQIKYGTEAEVSLIEDETKLTDAKIKLQQLKNDEEEIRIKLNMITGKQVNEALNLKKVDIPYEVFKIDNLDDIIEKMLTKYHTIKSMEEKERIDINQKDVVKDYVDDSTTEIENALKPSQDYKNKEEDLEDEIIELGYKMKDEKRNIEAKIRMDYNKILNLKNDIEARKLDCDKANTLLETEKAKLKVGLSTQVQCDAAEENKLMAECGYNKAKLNYYIAVENFKNYTKAVR